MKTLITSTLVALNLLASPPIISDVKARSGVTDVVISWAQDTPGTATIFYGPTTKMGSQTAKLPVTEKYSQSLTGLLPATTYYYRIRVENAGGEVSQTTVRQTTTKKEFKVFSVVAEPDDQGILAKHTVQFTATIAGTGDLNVKPRWSCSKGYILQSGLYTAPATPGEYTVTATSRQDPTKFSILKVRVLKEIKSIEFDPRDIATPMKPGETRQIRIIVR